MSTSSIENLERQAAEERTELHRRANELRTQVRMARQNLDIGRNARRHFGSAAAVLTAVGLFSGYLMAGLFTRR